MKVRLRKSEVIVIIYADGTVRNGYNYSNCFSAILDGTHYSSPHCMTGIRQTLMVLA